MGASTSVNCGNLYYENAMYSKTNAKVVLLGKGKTNGKFGYPLRSWGRGKIHADGMSDNWAKETLVDSKKENGSDGESSGCVHKRVFAACENT